MLRQFVDSNNDNVVDTWSYFRGGLEVYRDIDANFNGKADQYRWFHTGGSRWGLDSNEDGKIDAWKTISAEEAAEEVVAALRTKDAARFARLLLTKDEIGQARPAQAAGRQARRAPRRGAEDVRQAREPTARSTRRPSSPTSAACAPAPCPPARAAARRTCSSTKTCGAWCSPASSTSSCSSAAWSNVDGAWKLIDGPALGAGDQAVAGFFYDAEGVAPPAAARRRAQRADRGDAEDSRSRSRSSTSNSPRPRPTRSRRSTPSGPTCWSSSPPSPTARPSASSGSSNWPTWSAPPSRTAAIPRAWSG